MSTMRPGRGAKHVDLAEKIRLAIARAVNEHFPDPTKVPPDLVLTPLAAVSGHLLAQLRHTPEPEVQFCRLVTEHAVAERKLHLS